MSPEKEQVHPQKLVILALLLSAAYLAGCGIAAFSSHSLTIQADLLNSFLDFSGDAVLFGAMRLTRHGRWAALDYGPGKIENLGSLVVALVMFLGLVVLGVQVFAAIRSPEAVSGTGILIGLGVAFCFCCLDLYLWWRAEQTYRRSPSPLLDTFRRATLNALLVGAMVCATLASSLVFDGGWMPYLDLLTALVLGAFAFHHARQIIRHSLRDLVDHAIAEPLQVIINQHLVRHFESYLHLEGVRSRCAGSAVFIEISLGFEPGRSIGEIQATADELRAGLERDIPSARVTIIPLSHGAAGFRPPAVPA